MKIRIPDLSQKRIFQKSAVFILIFFMSLMVYVTGIAMIKKSGSTRMDMSRVQQMRYSDEPLQTAAK